MVVLDIAAPILLMLGITMSNAANVSLLNNFEIVATSLIAFFVFKEALSKRLVLAIALVTAASIALSFEGHGSFQFNAGSLLVLGAACCWGLENNCTRMLSSKSSVQITTIKGIFSGLGSLMVAATVLMVKDTIALQHTHEHTHTHCHEHRHGELIHTHVHDHAHIHTHTHGEDENVHSHEHESIEGHEHTHLA